MKTILNRLLTLTLGLGLLVSLSACKGGDKHDEHDGHDHGQEKKSAHHHHEPPHGGTGLTLGDEEFHIEFLRDAATGKMKAWILLPHMSGYARILTESFEVTAKVGTEDKTLTFKAQASTATGETVGNTSLFEAEADWLKTTDKFDAILKKITIRGREYKDVKFNFPKGSEE
jgi:hypothetical protein